ncbi:unnamed protein product, partial [Mesorhabditis spiculigera]
MSSRTNGTLLDPGDPSIFFEPDDDDGGGLLPDRVNALHSAINFLILGLAVADLLVALFVMPYAVYVHVQNGEWYLGNLMCDIYMASDVACSTASILLLAVISFDRYRAVSRPIQYSRQAQNIKRVFVILGIIWMISVLVASPMVLGMNTRPANASERECRSSIISFVIPCVLVLFVYIRIMVALKQRERAAKMRRISQLQQHSTTRNQVEQRHISVFRAFQERYLHETWVFKKPCKLLW